MKWGTIRIGVRSLIFKYSPSKWGEHAALEEVVREVGEILGPGTSLGPYQVQKEIGRGGMGTVYLGYHAGLDRMVAVKVMNSLSWDASSAARFQREARTIGRLRHPNIVSVFDFGEHEGVPYMIVEYVPGGNLDEAVLPGETLPAEQVVLLLRGVAAALDYAHGMGVVHRDVKPSNVLISRDGTPVIVDFGLSKLTKEASLTATGVVSGTPAFMAPEQATGSQVGPAADVYALSVMAYRLLVGRPPFEAESPIELLYQHVHTAALPPSALDSRYGPAVDAVFARSLAKSPGDRWPTCMAMVEALATALGIALAPQQAPPTPPPGTHGADSVARHKSGATAIATATGTRSEDDSRSPQTPALLAPWLEHSMTAGVVGFVGILSAIVFAFGLLVGAR
jgi:serine/threonine-protein kinase